MTSWATEFPRNLGTNRIINDPVPTVAAALSFDPTGTDGAFYGTGTETNNGGSLSVTIGDSATTLAGVSAVALGEGASATATRAMAIGPTTVSSATAAVSVGYLASAATQYSIAIGSGANTSVGDDCIAIGSNARSNATNAVCVGNSSDATASGAAAFGVQTQATGQNSVALGPASYASSSEGIALGYTAQATAANATCIGDNIVNAQANSTLIANNATPNFRLLDPAVGTYVYNTVPSTVLTTATPTPTIAQMLGGMVRCSNAGAYTLTQTNITGAGLDATAALLPLSVGMTFRVLILTTGGGTPTIGAAAAGVTQYGQLVGGAGVSKEMHFVRTGAATWDAYVR